MQIGAGPWPLIHISPTFRCLVIPYMGVLQHIVGLLGPLICGVSSRLSDQTV